MSNKHNIIKLRRGTAAEWAASEPQPGGEVLKIGEPGYEKDTKKLKIGDGVTPWNSLPYIGGDGGDIIINPEDIQDIIGDGFLVSGSGINISYNDNLNSLTISTSGVSVVGHTHVSSDITNFNSSVSGLLPVTNILSGAGISVSNSSGVYTIEATGSGILSDQARSLVTTVFNKTGSPIPKMTAVYINGGQGDLPTVSLAIATSDMTSAGTYGLTYETIPNMQSGKVIVFGALTSLDTDQFNPTAPQGNVNGSVLYLSPSVPGSLTLTKPSAPNHIVAIGTIVRTHQNEGVIEVRVQNGFELEELHNVAISGVSDGQFLQYNSGTQLWVPSSSGNFTTLQVNGTNVSTSGHIHTSSNITDFTESVQDVVGASGFLVSGTGINISYNDGTNSLTIQTDPVLEIVYPVRALHFGGTLAFDAFAYNISPTYYWNGDYGDMRILNTIEYPYTSCTIDVSQSVTKYINDFPGRTLNYASLEVLLVDAADRIVGWGTTSTANVSGTTNGTGGTNMTISLLSFPTGIPNTWVLGGLEFGLLSNQFNPVSAYQKIKPIFIQSSNARIRSNATTSPSTSSIILETSSATGILDNYAVFDSNGNFGIGTNNPLYDLDVVGSGNFSNNLYVNGELVVGNLKLSNNTISSSSGNIIISPSGNGALQRDGGGDPRGTYAVDWQLIRASGNMVASGDGSVIGGGSDNTSSSPRSTVGGGMNNTSSGWYSTVSGGKNNIASGQIGAQYGRSTVGGGSNNTASGNYSVVGGGAQNSASKTYSAITGGKSNTASHWYSTVGGGKNNTASGYDDGGPNNYLNGRATVGGGDTNSATANFSTIGGGLNNTASGSGSTIGGGGDNTAAAECATVGGGQFNSASGNYSTVGGGTNNTASGNYSVVGGGGSFNVAAGTGSAVSGGFSNTSSGSYSAVGGGSYNTASGTSSTIGGGTTNTASGGYSTVSGGQGNTASAYYSTISGGYNNTSSGNYSVVGGGFSNTSSGDNSTVGGGRNNTSSSFYSTVGGGDSNTSSGDNSTVGGGFSNTSSGNGSTVGGGIYNTSSGVYSTVDGGRNNTSSGFYSTVGGGFLAVADRYGMRAYAAGSFDATSGSAQSVNFVLRRTTSDATPATLFLDGNSTLLTIPSGKALFATVTVAGIINGGSKAAHYVRKVAIKNVAGVTSLIGAVSTLGTDTEDDASYDVSITADNTNDALQINVTGKTGETIRWVAHVEGVEIAYG